MNGVSVLNARGKLALNSFYQLYAAFGIPTYLIFDNDRGGKEKEVEHNVKLLSMLGEDGVLEPDGIVRDDFAIVEGDYESAVKANLDQIEPGKYERLSTHANAALGGDSKGLRARFMAQRLVEEDIVPPFIEEIVEALRRLGEAPVEDQGGDLMN